jgi:hypothetical protein
MRDITVLLFDPSYKKKQPTHDETNMKSPQQILTVKQLKTYWLFTFLIWVAGLWLMVAQIFLQVGK